MLYSNKTRKMFKCTKLNGESIKYPVLIIYKTFEMYMITLFKMQITRMIASIVSKTVSLKQFIN